MAVIHVCNTDMNVTLGKGGDITLSLSLSVLGTSGDNPERSTSMNRTLLRENSREIPSALLQS